MIEFPDFYPEYMANQGFEVEGAGGWHCVGALQYTGQAELQRDIDNLKAGLAEVDVVAGFLPVVAPASVAGVEWDESPYATEEEFVYAVADVLRVNAGAYAIEQANTRHEHEWRIWEDVALPEGKKLIPGVVTHHTNVVEHPQLVAQRLTRLAEIVGRENVIGGTDCGFAQGAFLQRVHPEIQWAKLTALAEGARLATQQLWSGAVAS
jgi:hypothetical protein